MSSEPLEVLLPTSVFTGASFRTSGKHAEARYVGDGPARLMKWQQKAFQQLAGETLRRCTAPTGSGKSMLMRALGCRDRQQGLKVLIAVPQRVIADAFGEKHLRMPDGSGDEHWCLGANPDDGSEQVQGLINFLTRPLAFAPSARIHLCTHAALVAAFARLREESKETMWKGTSLFIDEAHHSRSDFTDEEDKPDEKLQNQLGTVVRHYLAIAPGPLTLVTATWFRTDSRIIPTSYANKFSTFVLPIDEYLESLLYLRNIDIRFIVGAPEAAVQSLIAANPKAKTLLFLHAMGTAELPTPEAKEKLVAQLQQDLNKFSLNVCDLVTPEGRDVRLQQLRDAIRKGVATPDMLLLLNIGVEGFDWPEASRVILLSPRGSVLTTIQMLGRVLRDYKGKKVAEFNIVLPVKPGTTEIEPENIRDYLKVLVASLALEWQFRRVELLLNSKEKPSKAEEEFNLLLENPEVSQKLVQAALDASIATDGLPQTWDTDVSLRIEEIGSVFPELIRPAVESVAKNSLRRFVENVGLRLASEITMDVELQQQTLDGPNGPMRLFATKFGYRTLRELRQRLGKTLDIQVRSPTRFTEEVAIQHIKRFHEDTLKWPTRHTTTRLPEDGRSWVALDAFLREKLGKSLAVLVAQLSGIPERDSFYVEYPAVTIEVATTYILKAYELTGRWPTRHWITRVPVDGRSWDALDTALRHQGSSLSLLISKITGTPRRVHCVRDSISIELARTHVLAFNKLTGGWPSQLTKAKVLDDGRTWATFNLALKKLGTSLRKLVAELGGRALLSVESAKVQVKAHHALTNEWPTTDTKSRIPGDGRTWGGLDGLLRRRGSSLPKVVAEVSGIPEYSSHKKVTLELARTFILAHHAIANEWPHSSTKSRVPEDGRTWNTISAALLRNTGVTLTELVTEMSGRRVRSTRALGVATLRIKQLRGVV